MWKTISLELTLKPYCTDLSDAGFRRKTIELFHPWERLWRNGEKIKVMLWTSDGSELLEYDGKMETPFEYACWVGSPNSPLRRATQETPDREVAINHRPGYRFMKEPPVWRYGDLKRLVACIKAALKEEYGNEPEVGTTFDPGGEFAVSHFKYGDHRPELLGQTPGATTMVCCYRNLHADTRSRAAYPNGIPEGEPFGCFLGKQAGVFLRDMGFDFIWFSNGFGFGMETWGATGATFDGEKFFPEKAELTRERILKFWRDFRAGCPEKYAIETRGTNLTTGIDLASDGSPLREIYEDVPNLLPPPNSPWAALDANYGLELAGMMTHSAELPPGKGFPFRFYTHDPWWINSPWIDRYDHLPNDIYLPLAVSRINAEGEVECAEQLNFLTIDDVFGNSPEIVPREVIPALLHAAETAPDQLPPVIWLYPFDEMHDRIFAGEAFEEVNFTDWQIINAINSGFPVSGVVSTRAFLKAPAERFAGRVLVIPTMVSEEVQRKLNELDGSKQLFYGPAHGKAVEKLLSLEPAVPLSVDAELPGYGRIRHLPVTSGGTCDRVLRADAPAEVLLMSLFAEGERPMLVKYGKDRLWLRGCSSFGTPYKRLPNLFDEANFYRAEKLFVKALAYFDWHIGFLREEPFSATPYQMLHWHDNALMMNCFSKDTTVRLQLRFPDGAPLFRRRDLLLRDGKGIYPAERCASLEARFFISGPDAVIRMRRRPGRMHSDQFGMTVLNGLNHHRVVFRPPVESGARIVFRENAEKKFTLYSPSQFPYREEYDDFGKKYILEDVSGELAVLFGIPSYEKEPISPVEER